MPVEQRVRVRPRESGSVKGHSRLKIAWHLLRNVRDRVRKMRYSHMKSGKGNNGLVEVWWLHLTEIV